MNSAAPSTPEWDRLYETASAQEGLFTSQQAALAGYSPQLLTHHLHSGNIQRIRRGIYRLVHFPLGEQEDLVVAWLWSEQQGVFSHATALALHELSDILPHRMHLTLPAAWQKRRFRLPEDVVLHHADVPQNDMTWVGVVPATSVARTLLDYAVAGGNPEHVLSASEQALSRGLVSKASIAAVQQAISGVSGVD